jgi:hypothetical protein
MKNTIRALPNLWPSQLLPRPWEERAFPFNQRGLELTYLGRNAVWRSVRRLGLEGAEVIVPAYHHGVEVAALLAAGVRVRFARVDSQARLDLEHLEAQVGPETRALYVIHYAGFPQPMEPLRDIARRHGLRLIEDCALALFSSDGERPLGSMGDAAIFCFYKTLPVAHGGALWVGERSPSGRVPELRSPPLISTLSRTAGALLYSLEYALGPPGQAVRSTLKSVTRELRRRADELDVPVGTQDFDPAAVDLGMSPLLARLLPAVQVKQIIRHRRENWLHLHARLGELRRSLWEQLPPGVCPLFYGIRVADKEQALATLRARGVEAVNFWRFGHPAAPREGFPEVEELRRQVLELPCHQDLDAEQVERVALAAREVCAARPLADREVGSCARQAS